MATRLLMTGASGLTKLDVLPVSPINGAGLGRGGPTVLLEFDVNAISRLLLVFFFVLVVGFPPDQSANRRRGPRDAMMRSLPPRRLLAVANSLCPSALFWHDALVCSGFKPNPWVQQ